MHIKLALFMVAVVFLVIAKAPACLLDISLAAVSDNTLRMSSSRGSLWYGGGTVVARTASGRSAAPCLPLAWHFEPVGLLQGDLRWTSEAGSGWRGEWLFGFSGFRVRDAAVLAPAAIAFPMFPTAVAHAGWRGDLELQVPDWRCSWRGACTGQMLLLWKGASSTLLPGLFLGDYEIRFIGEGTRSRFEVRTLAGEITVSGNGSLSYPGGASFEGRLSGSPTILKMLHGIGGEIVRTDTQPGSLLIEYPAPH